MNDGATEPIRPATVHRAYGRGAAGFDGFVKSIPGYHNHLRMSTTRMGLSGGSRLRLLDIGCGTGASTAALLDAAPGAEVVAVDASPDMLAVARRKNWPPRVGFVQSRLETLAEAGVEGPFDGIFAAYLVSNLPDAEIGLRKLLALLRPGAPIAVHDYAVRGRMTSRIRWSLASWGYLIPMARLRMGSTDLLRYRTHRVSTTDGVESMTHHMQRAGFEDVRVQTVSGWQQHVVYTFLGRRPDEPDVVGQRQAARAAAAAAEVARAPDPPVEDAPGPEDAGGPDDEGYAEDPPQPKPAPQPKPGPQGRWAIAPETRSHPGPPAEPDAAPEPDADADTPPDGTPPVRD